MQSLTRGFSQVLGAEVWPAIEEIVFVDRNERTIRMLGAALNSSLREPPSATNPVGCQPLAAVGAHEAGPTPVRASIENPPSPAKPAGPVRKRRASRAESRAKKHVFVAMPFTDEFQDTYEYGIYIPVRERGYICEKVDETSITGDILQRIRDRIGAAAFVIADLTGARPNVYLEVGYAWGQGVPVIFLARDGEKLHFDVSTHRCIYYKSIRHLAHELDKLIAGLLPGP